MENYNECYHCGHVHPELCALVPAFRERGGAGLEWDDGIPHRAGAWTFTLSGTSNRAPFPGLSEKEKTHHKGEVAYPNLLLSAAAEHIAAFTLWPMGPDHTRIACEFLFHPDEIAKASFQSRRRGRILGRGQSAGLADLRVGAGRDAIARLPRRLLRTDGGSQSRHPALSRKAPRRPVKGKLRKRA